MFFRFTSTPEVAALAQREEDIIRCMTVAPLLTYNVHPGYDQFAALIAEAEQQGYTLDGLYGIFSSGRIPADIDALFRKYAPNWPPAGETVEGTAATPLLARPEEA